MDTDNIPKTWCGNEGLDLATVEEGSSHDNEARSKMTRLIRFFNPIGKRRGGRVSPCLVEGAFMETSDEGISLENLGQVHGESENDTIKDIARGVRRHSSLPMIPSVDIAGQRRAEIRNRSFSAGSNVSKIKGSQLISLVRRLQQRRVRLAAQQTNRKFGFLPYFLTLLYYMGISQLPSEPSQASGTCHRFGNNVQLVAFTTMSALTLLWTLAEVKKRWIYFRVMKDMSHFISLGYYVSTLATRGSQLRVFSKLGEETTSLMLQVEKIHATHGGSSMIRRSYGNVALMIILVSCSIATSLAEVFFAYLPFEEWTLYDNQKSRAYETAESILLWSTVNFENSTELIDQKYSSNFTTATYSLAILGDVLAFAGYLYENILLDLFVVLALEVYCIQILLSKRTKSNDETSKLPLLTHWGLYSEIRRVSDRIDDIFGSLLKFVHLRNMFFFSYLLLHWITMTSADIWSVAAMYSLMRILIAYFLSWKISEENQKLEASLIAYLKYHNHMDVDGNTVNIQGVLMDMKLNPIGLGRGEFYVNETFLLKMIGAVGAMFVFLSDARDKESYRLSY